VYPAQVPMIPKIVPPSDLVTANSVFSFAFYSSMAIGFIGAGPLLRYTGETGSLIVMAAFYVISALTTAYLPKDGDMKTFVRAIKTMDLLTILTKVGDNIMTGIRYVRTTPALFESMMLLTVTQITFAILGSLGPGFADKIMGIDVRDASLVMIGPAVAGVLAGSVWVGTVGYKYSKQTLINCGIVSAGVVLLVISLTVYLNRFTSFSWLFADSIIVPLELFLFFLLGIANSLLDVPANTILQDTAEESMRGKVYGLLAASVGGIGILPVLVGGILADTIGVGKVILFLGLTIALFGIRRVRYTK
jgi:MFS family permease